MTILPEAPQIVIQASSRSWSGGRDICLNQVAGKSALEHLVAKLFDHFPAAQVVVAAPAFDRDGCLPQALVDFKDRICFVFAHDASPLLRMLEATANMGDGFLRINGLNMFVQPQDVANMWALAQTDAPACIKFPDAYPAQLTFDFYRRDALQSLAQQLAKNDPAHVHPKYALFAKLPEACAVFQPEAPSDAQLSAYRELGSTIYKEERDAMTTQAIAVGDTLGFHYELATAWLKLQDRVLDIACGGYRGPQLLAKHAAHVTAADIDAEVIAQCQVRDGELEKLCFTVADVTAMPFEDAAFDVVTSFETVEHVDARAYFNEIARVLKQGGLLLLSTPQNDLGHIPINPQHRMEYKLADLLTLIEGFPFERVRVVGIKQGRVMVEGDPTGNNTFLVLRRV